MLYQTNSVASAARRSFVKHSIAATALAFTAGLVKADLSPNDADQHPLHKKSDVRELRLVNAGSEEILDVVYWQNHHYIENNIGQLNYFMRDLHAEKSFLMDKKLYDFMFMLQQKLQTSERIHVLSGYRTTETNAQLRKQSIGAAVQSFHVKGQAVDFYVPGQDLHEVQKMARSLILGGVGYYPESGFVHIDTGYARHWEST